MKTILNIGIGVLYAIPGIFFGVRGSDVFAGLAILILALVLALMAGSLWSIFLKLSQMAEETDPAEADTPKKVKDFRTVTFWIWAAAVAIALILGGTSYLGVALYGTLIGWISFKLQPDNSTKLVNNLLA